MRLQYHVTDHRVRPQDLASTRGGSRAAGARGRGACRGGALRAAVPRLAGNSMETMLRGAEGRVGVRKGRPHPFLGLWHVCPPRLASSGLRGLPSPWRKPGALRPARPGPRPTVSRHVLLHSHEDVRACHCRSWSKKPLISTRRPSASYQASWTSHKSRLKWNRYSLARADNGAQALRTKRVQVTVNTWWGVTSVGTRRQDRGHPRLSTAWGARRGLSRPPQSSSGWSRTPFRKHPEATERRGKGMVTTLGGNIHQAAPPRPTAVRGERTRIPLP